MPEAILEPLREAMEAKVAKAESAKPLTSKTGEAQEEVALLAGRATDLHKAYEERLSEGDQQTDEWTHRQAALEEATRTAWGNYQQKCEAQKPRGSTSSSFTTGRQSKQQQWNASARQRLIWQERPKRSAAQGKGRPAKANPTPSMGMPRRSRRT